MLKWLAWFIYALIPTAVTYFGDFSMKTMTILYFAFIAAAMIGWEIWEKARKKAPDEF